MAGSSPVVPFALLAVLQMELPDSGSDVGFLVAGIVSLVGALAVLVLLFYAVRRGWRPIADAVRYDRSKDE